MNKKVLIISTGGTFFYNAKGSIESMLSPNEIIKKIKSNVHYEIVEVSTVQGANIKFDTILRIKEILEYNNDVDGFIILTGTDSMEEVSYALDLIVDIQKPIIVTGSIKPTHAFGYDGIANLHDAFSTITRDIPDRLGTLILMNGTIHAARYAWKNDSGIIPSFISYPGPLADIRNGAPQFYWKQLPQIKRYPNIDHSILRRLKIMVWPMVIQPILPLSAIAEIDALVIAGMGTGSISDEIVELLSPEWTSKIPIILSTRCPVGFNYDNNYYPKSLEKYQSFGFKLVGYENLSYSKARIKLALELSAKS